MRAAVTGGTAVRLAGLPLPAGAKTGTAQDGGLRDGEYDNWMSAAAPMDAPEIVMTAWVQGPGTGGEQRDRRGGRRSALLRRRTARTSSPPARCRRPDGQRRRVGRRAARRLRSARAAPSATQVMGSSASLTGRPRLRSSSCGKALDLRGPAEHQDALRQHVGERLRGEVVQARGERPEDLVGDRPHGVGHLGRLHRRQPRPAGDGVAALHDQRAVLAAETGS